MKPIETKTKESQVKAMFNYLMSGCRFTGLEAIKLFGSIKASNRVGEIEKQYGVTVSRVWKDVKTVHGKKRVIEYFVKNPKSVRV